MDKASELIVSYGPKLIGAIVVLIVGLWIIKGLTGWANRLMTKRDFDESLRHICFHNYLLSS